MAKLKAWKSFSVFMALMLVVALGVVLMPASPVQAITPVYVDASRPDDSGDGSSWATAKKYIQSGGINIVDAGGTVNVAAGIYDEQVVITNSLTLQGAGDTTIIQPSSAAKLTTVLSGHFFGGTKQIAGIVVANVAGGSVTIKNLKVDESLVTTKPAGADYLAGIFYRETGGTVDTVTVVGTGAWSGGDRAYGIYLSAIANTVSVEVKGCTITNYDKNGIDAHGNELTADIHNNTITGRGPLLVGDEVQNGVNIMDWATGTVNNNTISNMAYAPLTWLAAGILFYHNGGTANGNTITDCQLGVIFQDGNATAEDNTINGETVGRRGLGWQRNAGFTGTFTVSFVGNTISSINDTGGTDGYAIAVIARPSFNCTLTVDSNQLTGGGATAADGVYVGAADLGSVVATITNNAISGWEYGIRLVRAVASGSTIVRNNISNNTNSGIWLAETAVNAGNVSIYFNNIVGNQTYGVNNGGTGSLDATNNWWGANDGPSASPGSGDKISANVDADPWLVLGISANPTSIVANGTSTSTITADMTKNSAGNPSGGYVPNGTQITFTTDKGSIGSLTVNKTTTSGIATATLTSSNTVETATVSAKAPGDAVQAKVSTNVNFVAGASSTMTVAASPTSIVANGTSTSTITATVKDQYGHNVADGTNVVFTTNHGTLGSSTVTKQTTGGVATATLTSVASSEVVIADVTATANGVSATTAVIFTKADAPVTQITTQTVTGSGTVTDTSTGGDVTIDATGDHTVTTAKYAGNPGGTPTFSASGNYYDVHLDSAVGVNSLTIEFCPATASTVIYYWNGTSWVAASNQAFVDGCIRVTITAATTPSLADLTGAVFGSGTPTPAPPAAAPPGPRASATPPRPLSPPSLTLQYLNINPQQVYANQPVTITTNVVNTGDEGGNYYLALKINGQVEQTKMVSVGAQGAQPVKLTVTKAQPGTYTVDIGGQRGSFVVLGAGGTAGSPGSSGLIAILILGVLVLMTVVLLMLRFRRPA